MDRQYSTKYIMNTQSFFYHLQYLHFEFGLMLCIKCETLNHNSIRFSILMPDDLELSIRHQRHLYHDASSFPFLYSLRP